MVEVAISTEEQTPDGHKAVYTLRFLGLVARESKIYLFQYNTGCLTTPTSWKVELACKRRPEEDSSHQFSFKLTRTDHSSAAVRSSLHVSFLHADLGSVVLTRSCHRNAMVCDDELNDMANIDSTIIRDVVSIRVSIEIENCHAEIDSSKAMADKSTMT